MSQAVEVSPRQRAISLLRAAVDALAGLDVAVLSDEELLDTLREVEVEKRRLAVPDHALVAEVDARGVGAARGCKNTTTLLMQLLRVDAREAQARLLAAQDLAPRRALSGEPLPPVFPLLAAASAQGAVSPVAAGLVARTIKQLPLDVQDARGGEIEETLVGYARSFGLAQLRVITRRLRETYDQDGRLASDADRERQRHLDVRQHADGTVSGSFLLDPVAGEALLTVLDAHAKPHPAADGVKDPRTPGQRRHDALKEALLLVLRTGQLPACGGVTTTIVLTLTLDQYDALTHTRHEEGRGRGRPRQPRAPGQPPGDRLIRTGHGALLDLDQAAPLLGDARIHPVVLDSLHGIHAYGSSHRIFTEGQRLAMTARDHGCSFPGCTAPPAWCQAHHIEDWALSGRTSVDNGTLLCGLHHRTFTDLGYTCTLINGTPHWTAPPWLDPTQTPTRNTAHNPA